MSQKYTRDDASLRHILNEAEAAVLVCECACVCVREAVNNSRPFWSILLVSENR